MIKKEVFLFLCSSYHLSLPIKCTQYENIAVFVECECEQNEEMDLFFLETDSIKCIEHWDAKYENDCKRMLLKKQIFFFLPTQLQKQ